MKNYVFGTNFAPYLSGIYSSDLKHEPLRVQVNSTR
jgi:hypothetical protein